MRRLAAALALAAVIVPAAARAAGDTAVARLPVDPSRPASVLAPVTLSGVFRVPRVDTSLYVGTSWLVRDLTVIIVRRDGRRERLDATSDLPGRILGVRLPADASQADRIEYEARAVSASAVPYVVSADALAGITARTWPYAIAFGALATLAALFGFTAVRRRSREAASLFVVSAAQAALVVPWLGIARPAPQLSQPAHALLQTASLAALTWFALRLAAPAAVLFRAPARLRVNGARLVPIVMWAIVVAGVVLSFGGDVLQDVWPIPALVDVVVAVMTYAALCALGVPALRGAVSGARAYLAAVLLLLVTYGVAALCGAATVLLAGTVAGAVCLWFSLANRLDLPEQSSISPADPAPASAPLDAAPVDAAVIAPVAAAPVPAPPAEAAPAIRAAVDGGPARPIFGAPPPREVLTDGRTGLGNRSALSSALDRAWHRARTGGFALALLRLDVDHFRRYNDAYGPDAGDDALCRIATALAASLPPNAPDDAMVARDGGDEFCVLLPGLSLTAAQAHGERVRSAVHALAVARNDVPARRLTVSVGAASIEPATTDDAFVVFARANAALYIAKAMGRDRVVADEPVQAFAKSESASA